MDKEQYAEAQEVYKSNNCKQREGVIKYFKEGYNKGHKSEKPFSFYFLSAFKKNLDILIRLRQ